MLLVDEACQTLEPDFAIAASMKVIHIGILTGDHKQLPPPVQSLNSGQNEFAPQFATSLFERLRIRGYPFRKLLTNYRMHRVISRHPIMETYEGKLINGPNVSRLNDPVGRT
ncbi:hypothetical protein MMC08_004976 [Hypocenomyce scalaris]|nr:hypothetical protein [Hypocenomyce scalaris]